MPAGSWQARLEATAHLLNGRTVVDPRHEGPLRLLKALYPEGPRCCHHVLVHPPGGIVGGDRLELRLDLQPGSHLLLTTPGATRFYRSAGAQAGQCVQAQLGPGSRLEWLPHETQLHDGALASSRLCLDLAEGAEAIGWDLLALGLPACGAPFLQGHIEQHLEIRGRWLERGRIEAGDRLLRESPLGLAGRTLVGTLWWARGGMGPAGLDARAAAAVDAARSIIGHAAAPGDQSSGAPLSAVTAIDDGLVVVRLLGHPVEPAARLFRRIRAAWRPLLWALPAVEPRIWAT
jgi:urease accessory protein